MGFLPLRLPPGSDLRRAIEAAALPLGAGGAFVVCGIGSLADPRVRWAGADEASVLTGAFEIVSLCGSIAENGAHLHIVVADEHGVVRGGHLAHGSVVRTTAEVLLAPLAGWQLRREFDAATGYDELAVHARGPSTRSS